MWGDKSKRDGQRCVRNLVSLIVVITIRSNSFPHIYRITTGLMAAFAVMATVMIRNTVK